MNSNSVKEIIFAVLIVTVLVTLGIILFSSVEEGWSLLDAVYFVVTTAFTVGYGDLVPSPENYILTGFFIIIVCTLVLASSSVVGKGIITIIQDRIMIEKDKILIIKLDERIQDIESSEEEITEEQITELRSILSDLETDINRRKNYRT